MPVILAIVVFTLIGLVYLVTLLSFYPGLPVITRNAEILGSYRAIYPPFRMDEFNYYTIARNIIEGNVYQEGSIEKSFTIGFPLLSVPFIFLWDKLGGYLANLVIVWCSLFVFYRIARRYVSNLRALIMTAILAFATLNWFYAVSLYTEPLAQLLILLGFFFLTEKGSPHRMPMFLSTAGALTGLNLFVRPHYILLALPFFLCSWIGKEKHRLGFNHRAFWYVGGLAAVILVWMIRNSLFFGGPLNFEYSRLVARLTGQDSATGYSGNFFWGIHRLLFDRNHGLLPISPVLLLFPAGLHQMWKHGLKRESLTLLFSVVLIVVFIATTPYPYTEFGLGSRHMVPIIPLIFLPVIFFLDGTRFSRITLVALTAYSFWYAGIGWFTGGAEYVGEKGFFPGLLHDNNSRAILLVRKELLPRKSYRDVKELLEEFYDAREAGDYYRVFQTLHPAVLENIRNNERSFMSYLRFQSIPDTLIVSLDPDKGILLKQINFR